MEERERHAERPLRLFIAIPAPAPVREAAEAVIARLRGAGDVRWVLPENLHLTVKFLGETPPDRVPQIEEGLRKTANNYSRFMVELERVWAQPNPRRPQTLWIEIADKTGALARLARDVEGALAPLGYPPEKRAYRGHLTLGRVKSGRGAPDLTRRLREEEERGPLGVAWAVEEIHLVRSDLQPSGPVYTALSRFPLGAGRPEEQEPPIP